MLTKKTITLGTITLVIVISFIVLLGPANPFSWNSAGYREVVETPGGKIWVRYKPGFYTKGFLSKITPWPNVLTVSYSEGETGATVDLGPTIIRFQDGSQAKTQAIVRYTLPISGADKEMIKIHTEYQTPKSLALKGLKPFTSECLKSAAQLMTSEKHYLGGRSQMSQDFLDQLSNGLYLLETIEKVTVDTLTGEEKRSYITQKIVDNVDFKRKKSSLITYGITVQEATVEDVDYEERIDKLLGQKIDATTKASISKQKLITAQQEALTKEAEGKQKLVEIEYLQKEKQTKLLVEADTRIEQAKRKEDEEKISLRAAKLEAQKIKTLADDEAYKKRAIIQADGALEKKLEVYKDVMTTAYTEFAKQKWVPEVEIGKNEKGSGGGNATQMIDLISAQTAKQLSLDMKVKKGN